MTPVPTPARARPDDHGHRSERRWGRGDTVAVALVVVLVVVAAVVGRRLLDAGAKLVLPTPPLLAQVGPHVGWFTPVAAAVAVAVLLGRRWQLRREGEGRPLRWRPLLLAGWVAGLAWSVSLTLANGWRRGWSRVLTNPNEYLHDLPLIRSGAGFVATFTDHIAHPRQSNPVDLVALEPSWTTHVAGHPPLATLVFWWLQEVGLPGGAWAALLCVLVGSAVVVALPVTVRALGAPLAARRLVPLMVLFPGVVWMAVSADGLFAGVATSGLALVSVGAAARSSAHLLTSFAGGVLLGAALYLNYGLVLFGVTVLVAFGFTVWRGRDRWRSVLRRWAAAVAGVLAVAAPFTALGFWWFDGLAALRVRYYQGIAADRPYWYFLFANLAALAVSVSPFLVVGARRAVAVVVTAVRSRRRPGAVAAPGTERLVVAALCCSGLAAVLLANLSGLSKAETERIWLPFAAVCWTGGALLRGRLATVVLVGAAVSAFAVNHLLHTGW